MYHCFHSPSFSPNQSFRTLSAVFVLLLIAGSCQSQFRPPIVEITHQDTVGYTIVEEADNQIENSDYLAPFFHKLYTQRTQGGQKVSIVHIGDSHILGNFLTAAVRERMQNAFGDAGRGLIFPYKVAQTSGPKDYLVQTNCRWESGNCVRDLDEVTDYGASGFSIETINPKGELSFRLVDTATSETRLFTKITVFHRNSANAFDFSIADETTGQQALPVIEDDLSQTFYFDRPVGAFTLKTKKSEKQKSLRIDAFSLENELSGVLYHSIGVNGAKYSDFARSQFFAPQLRELTPDLVILSFGTNEAQAKVTDALLTRQIDELVRQILTQWPHAQIMLTTPADSYLRGKGFNPYMPDVAKVIRNYARQKGYALWDLHRISGGENSAERWKSRGLMSSDSVHYSKTGYAVQGKLLYQSLIKAYNEAAHIKQVQRATAH